MKTRISASGLRYVSGICGWISLKGGGRDFVRVFIWHCSNYGTIQSPKSELPWSLLWPEPLSHRPTTLSKSLSRTSG